MSNQNQHDGYADPQLTNIGVPPGLGEAAFRNPVPGPSTGTVLHGPPLPPRPDMSMQNYGMNQGYGYGMGSYGMGGYGGYGFNNVGGFGMGGMGMGGMPYGGYNRFGGNIYTGDVESRFVQMAEERSRPAFDSIQGVVNAVGSVAMMLENTFFALTSSFRAILSVTENFGRLRSLFSQVWSTFAVFRTLNWMIKKLLVMLGIRTEAEFMAWADAVYAQQGEMEPYGRGSSWPILLFFAVITAAPYIVHKMLVGLSTTNETLNDPKSWVSPLRGLAEYDFQATNPQEISFGANQLLTIAPQHLQSNLWTSGWLMGSADMKTVGLIPINYIKVYKHKSSKEPSADPSQQI